MDTEPNAPHSGISESQPLRSLLAGPQHPRDDFIAGKLTFGQIYAKAHAIGNQINALGDSMGPICLCAEDKGLVAAALIAALREGFSLMIPYAFDGKTLEGALERMPYTHAVVEGDLSLPIGVTALPYSRTGGPIDEPPLKALGWKAPWLYLFTGGSTGSPQIWSKTPCNLLAEAAYLTDTFGITRSDTILATVPTNHIYGLLYSVILPLVSGASVNATTPSFPNEIIDDLDAANATVLVSIPAHYRALKETPMPHQHVRIAFSSAGALPEQDATDFFSTTGIAITEIYGSTETGGIARRTRARGEAALYPFDCADVRIENQHLMVRSPFLSTELPKGEDGFFETADRAQWADPLSFALLGRSDGIIKVGGKRVDLAVIKEVLMAVAGVSDIYVYAQPVQSGRENEILVLVEGTATIEQLSDTAKQLLPPYARPRSIKITHQIPMTSTGKYRRTAIEAYFKTTER